MRVVFMGTPDFANPSLKKLHASSHQLVAVVTKPDRPAGRGRRISPTPVKSLASELGYPLIQPESLKDDVFLSNLMDMAPDVFVVIGFPILPNVVLSIPPRGSVNLHASLLPKYRGAAPIQRCLLAGEIKTGVTTFLIEPQVDTGDILLQQDCSIRQQDDFGSLWARLSEMGSGLVIDTLDGLELGTLSPQRQDRSLATPAPKISPQELIIEWGRSAGTIANQIRAFSPKPGAYTTIAHLRLKLFIPKVLQLSSDSPPGTLLSVMDDGLGIATGNGLLHISEVQLEGRRRMAVTDFCRGYELSPGITFGTAD